MTTGEAKGPPDVQGDGSALEAQAKPARVLCLPGEGEKGARITIDDLSREVTLRDFKERANEVLDK